MRQGRGRVTRGWRAMMLAAWAGWCCGGPSMAWGQASSDVAESSEAVNASGSSALQMLDGAELGAEVGSPSRRGTRSAVPSAARVGSLGASVGTVAMPSGGLDLDPTVLGPPPGLPEPELRPEGDFVVDQWGRLRTLASGAVAFVFLDELREPTGRAMVVQPSQRLETMLRAAAQQDRPALFRVTGQVHVYGGVNYLLPTGLSGFELERPEPVQADPGAADAGAMEPAEPEAAAEQDPAPEVGVGVDRGSARRVMDAMAAELSDLTEAERTLPGDGSGERGPLPGGSFGGISAPLDPGRSRTATITPVTTAPGGGVGAPATLLREGALIVNRPGRLVRSADARAVVFAFESDGPDLAEAPIAVLPCRARAWMEQTVAERGDSAVFVLSGRVLQFQGLNYVLPSVVKLRVERAGLGG